MDYNVKLLGFGFNKILAEKKSDTFKNVKISTNINVSEITKIESNITKDDILKIEFNFVLSYGENLAELEFIGSLMLSADSKSSKDIIKQWKDKAIDPQFRLFLINLIFRKANLRALQLEEEMNIPLHIQLPKLAIKN